MRNGTWRFSGIAPDGKVIGFEFEVTHGTALPPYGSAMIIGRGPENCDFIILDSTISRMHAELRLNETGGLMIRDLDSTNGTFIGDEKITGQWVVLEPGSEVLLGLVRLTVSVRD